MHRDSNELSLDRDPQDQGHPNEINYAHPEYYQPKEQYAYYAQPIETHNPYDPSTPTTSYTEASSESGYAVQQMSEYRGPKSIEGYTEDAGSEQREAAERGSMEEKGKRKKGLAGIGTGLAAFIAAIFKLPWLLVVLKFGWLGLSAFISIVLYSLVFGWYFAVGLVVLLFIHEMGHAVVMKLKRIPIGGIVFVPFLGAAVTMRQMPRNALDEAEVGIAGPIAGAIASGVCLWIAQSHPDPTSIWAPLAYFGFFLNLFNLIPIVPFDGGRVLAAIDRRIWLIGFLGLLAFQIWEWLHGDFSAWLLIYIAVAATQLGSRGFSLRAPASNSYYDVPVATRISLSLLYFGLVAVLVLGMSMAHAIMPAVTR